jgi:hypothetical protein
LPQSNSLQCSDNDTKGGETVAADAIEDMSEEEEAWTEEEEAYSPEQNAEGGAKVRGLFMGAEYGGRGEGKTQRCLDRRGRGGLVGGECGGRSEGNDNHMIMSGRIQLESSRLYKH